MSSRSAIGHKELKSIGYFSASVLGGVHEPKILPNSAIGCEPNFSQKLVRNLRNGRSAHQYLCDDLPSPPSFGHAEVPQSFQSEFFFLTYSVFMLSQFSSLQNNFSRYWTDHCAGMRELSFPLADYVTSLSSRVTVR